MFRPTPPAVGALLLSFLALACTSSKSEINREAADAHVSDANQPKPQPPIEPGEHGTRHSCLGGAGAQCPDDLLCVSTPGSSGGRCEDRPRGVACGEITCSAEEMCCEGLCMQPQPRAICRPGQMARGSIGTRCSASEPCIKGLACVPLAARVASEDASAGHCTLSSGEAPPPRTDGPCTKDADCLAFINCGCGCEPRLASIPHAQGEAWMKMCDGQPPPNCGVASPCMNFEASCDSGTATCVVRRKPTP